MNLSCLYSFNGKSAPCLGALSFLFDSLLCSRFNWSDEFPESFIQQDITFPWVAGSIERKQRILYILYHVLMLKDFRKRLIRARRPAGIEIVANDSFTLFFTYKSALCWKHMLLSTIYFHQGLSLLIHPAFYALVECII